MAERLLPTPEIPGSSPTIVHFSHNRSSALEIFKVKKKEAENGHLKNLVPKNMLIHMFMPQGTQVLSEELLSSMALSPLAFFRLLNFLPDVHTSVCGNPAEGFRSIWRRLNAQRHSNLQRHQIWFKQVSCYLELLVTLDA